VTYGSDDDKVTSFMSDDSDDLSYRIRSLYAERGPLIVAIGAAIGSLALICLFAFLLLQSGDSEQPTTPTLTPVGSGSELDTDTFAFLSISDTGAISVTMETPIFLNVGGEEFSVQAEVLPTQGSWNPVPANETTSVWVYGSVINYVFGLDDAAENRELLERLVAGDEIVLTTRSGMSSTFVVSRRQEVSSDNREIFAQRSPGVTLVLLEEDTGEQRLVVQGRFVVSEAKSDPRVGSTVKLGETAQLENLQITANSVSFQFDVPGVPAGLAAFHVDYQMQNVGASAVDASSLSMVLRPQPRGQPNRKLPASFWIYPARPNGDGHGRLPDPLRAHLLRLALAGNYLRYGQSDRGDLTFGRDRGFSARGYCPSTRSQHCEQRHRPDDRRPGDQPREPAVACRCD
jgi:hypothetical protein